MYKVHATAGKRPASRSAFYSAVYLALFFTVAVVSQLFAFEDFPAIITSYGLPIDDSFSTAIAASIVCFEVFAIPFLTFMKVSPLMRLVSMTSGGVALLFWLSVGIWQNVSVASFQTAGLFGSLIAVPQGWWLVTYMVALIVLFVFTVTSIAPLELKAHARRSLSRKKI